MMQIHPDRTSKQEKAPEEGWEEVLEGQPAGMPHGGQARGPEEARAGTEDRISCPECINPKRKTKMTRKIAVPTSNGLLDGHFGHCQQFAMIEVEDGEIKSISYLDAPPHQPGLLPPWLAERGASDIIAGGMGQRAIDLFNEKGVNVFVGAPALTPEELVTGFLNETLSFSANYCDH
jgi:predicted Fe-Mo cluster-binding NifX family protein